jgi:hypothetical protein
LDKPPSAQLEVEVASPTTSSSWLPSDDEVKVYSKTWENIAANTNSATPFGVPTVQSSDTEYIQSVWKDVGILPNAIPYVEQGRKHWREVRLFVSSTFTDYFAEREILVKQVSGGWRWK